MYFIQIFPDSEDQVEIVIVIASVKYKFNTLLMGHVWQQHWDEI